MVSTGWERSALVCGTTPSELPVEQPTRTALVIKRKTAKARDFSIPPKLMIARADWLIE
jgi:putative tryptophan/tyrosine transport system substrate-binding protein